ncbi:MAG: tol-pal system protein YbgF, partial [Candidatus Methylomirabilis sp.]
ASILAVLVGGCGGDLSLHLMQRDLDSVRSEVAAVSRTSEGERQFVEERLGKLEADLKARLEKVAQEKREDAEGFLRSQASLSTKLDELIEEARMTQGRVEEIGHRISEMNKRVDALGGQVGQVGRRQDGFEKQLSQALVTAQEAKMTSQTAGAAAQEATAGSQQTAQEVTNALRQMADQTNAALQQVNTNTQLALVEARKAVGAQQTAQPIAQQAPVAVKLPPPISVSPPTAAAPPPSPSAPPPSPPSPRTGATTPGELYKNALNEYTRGKYDRAIDGFRTYIILYPDTSLLPNAQYWLAESFYRQKNYGLAIKQFELYLTEYPDHPKVAGALLKQGFAYLELGSTSQGRTALTNLIKRFPKSPEARSAKQRLSKVKKPPASRSGAKALSKGAS